MKIEIAEAQGTILHFKVKNIYPKKKGIIIEREY